MKKQTILTMILMALTFLAFNLATVGRSKSDFQRSAIPTVRFCDLLRSPNKYKNRIVRIRAVYNSWFEGSELMNDCPNSYGAVWAYFPDEVYTQSKQQIVEKLEDVFFRYIIDKSGKISSQFSSWQTELVLTGRIAFSKKKNYGIHGGSAYLFTIATVEEIGVIRVHDPETGLTTEYVSESSEERKARHSREAESVCASNSQALDKVLAEFASPEDKITLVGRLGNGERLSTLNKLRLTTIRDYFVNCAGVRSDRVIVREGEPSRFEGRVNVYRKNELSKTLLAGKNLNLCLKPCKIAAEQPLGADSP
jgi:hypothetical protein